jgi:hypothetical protein
VLKRDGHGEREVFGRSCTRNNRGGANYSLVKTGTLKQRTAFLRKWESKREMRNIRRCHPNRARRKEEENNDGKRVSVLWPSAP